MKNELSRKRIYYTYSQDSGMNPKAERAVAEDIVDQIRVLSGILFRLLDSEMDRLQSDDVDLDAAWEVLNDLWDALYVIRPEEEMEDSLI